MRGTAMLLLAALMSLPGRAAAQTDVKGSRDHPLILRYAGSSIIGYATRDYEELTLPLGRTVPVEDAKAFEFKFAKSQKVEGKFTRLLYVAPEQRSTLEILRNYEASMKSAGFQPLFTCSDRECDSGNNPFRFATLVTSAKKGLDNRAGPSATAFTGPENVRYLAAKLSAPGTEVYASLFIAIESFDHHKATANHPLVLLEVVETKSMDTNMVKVDAATMAKDIGSGGRSVLYGIHFDTGKDVIKPESEPTLAEIGSLLKQDRALKLFVVGHTDSVGGYDSNMDLSTRRANAVVGHLRTRYGIEVGRLRAAGVGSLAPVASNDSDDGRAKNRRVELVKQ